MNHSISVAIVIPVLAVIYLLIIYLILGRAQKIKFYPLWSKKSKSKGLSSTADFPSALEKKSII
ncbi:MAG: hypothetical protein HC796_01210 [Synechococcaceae cyanobacterium RL_1_2]|nr:hypothetical protein [Synechococcaceae cyanobacterium RL_1_2]